MSASNLDRTLIDPRGERLGEIKDLVISGNGEVEEIIIEAEMLDEDLYVALPYDQLGSTYYGIVYDITIDKLKKLPKAGFKD